MARCPFAQQRILPENATQAKITPRAVILHTAVDGPGPTDLAAYFGQAKVKAESHFYVTMRGDIVQMMDTGVEADANAIADKWAISIETEDDSARRGSDIIPWTPAQIGALVRLVDWCCATHDIPRRRSRGPRLPDAAGIGCHSQPARERWSGVSRGVWQNPWTGYQGKTCPGDARWAQYPSIVEQVAALDGTTTPDPPKDWFDMATKAELQEVVDDRLLHLLINLTGSQVTDLDAETYNLRSVTEDLKWATLAVGVNVITALSKQVAPGVDVDEEAIAAAITDEFARRLAD